VKLCIKHAVASTSKHVAHQAREEKKGPTNRRIRGRNIVRDVGDLLFEDSARRCEHSQGQQEYLQLKRKHGVEMYRVQNLDALL
jgi:hypothetical protein